MEKIDRKKLGKYVRRHPEARLKDIARHFGCKVSIIGKAIREAGIDYREYYPQKQFAAELGKYVRKHPEATQKEVAGHFGCHQADISRALKAAGIRYRRKGRGIPLMMVPGEIEEYIRDNPKATQEDIAGFFGCSLFAVHDVVEAHNIGYKSKRGETPPFASNPELLELYVRDHPEATQREIADHFSCHPSVVGKALRVHGIKYAKKQGGVPPKIQRERLRAYVRKHPDATRADIAAYFRCSLVTVDLYMRGCGLAARRQRKAKLPLEELRSYIRGNPNASQADIARHFGYDPSVVHRAIKKL